jgi:Rrf2 family nitric oxide-sensitive transcriptional repressor
VRLTTFTDYSLRVLIYVAARREGRATIGDVAHAFGVSGNHLTKVVHFLGKQGFLANVRGRGGGLELAVPAGDINIADVVRRTEGAAVPVECFDAATNHCVISRACDLRRVLAEAVRAFYGVLAQYTLEDLVRDDAPLAKILFAPASRAAARR